MTSEGFSWCLRCLSKHVKKQAPILLFFFWQSSKHSEQVTPSLAPYSFKHFRLDLTRHDINLRVWTCSHVSSQTLISSLRHVCNVLVTSSSLDEWGYIKDNREGPKEVGARPLVWTLWILEKWGFMMGGEEGWKEIYARSLAWTFRRIWMSNSSITTICFPIHFQAMVFLPL